MSMIIPFGPQHPVLPEPLQLRLEIDEEKVLSATPVIGYVHRGLEKLAEQKDFQQDTYLIERVCGICSFMHSLSYCMGIEEMMNIDVPPRAKYLRIIWAELHRMHSHLLAVGLLADAFGFENLFMKLWRTRELVMDAMEYTTGGRVMLGSCCIGGVRKDINPQQAKFVLDNLDAVEKDLRVLLPIVLNDYSVKQRMVGIGVLDKTLAHDRGAVGPTARGSGLLMDHRLTGYCGYNELEFEPVVEHDGDCYARTKVRMRELYQSINLV
ncbi:MAG: nickel-dependent hydrogenase large subunit, partial [Victivallaceae bacterium]